MLIKISDKYFVEVDRFNFTLYEVRKPTAHNSKNETVNHLIGHFMNMKHVLQKIVWLESKPDGDETIKEFLERYKDIEKNLIELVDKLFVEKKLTRKELEEHGE